MWRWRVWKRLWAQMVNIKSMLYSDDESVGGPLILTYYWWDSKISQVIWEDNLVVYALWFSHFRSITAFYWNNNTKRKRDRHRVSQCSIICNSKKKKKKKTLEIWNPSNIKIVVKMTQTWHEFLAAMYRLTYIHLKRCPWQKVGKNTKLLSENDRGDWKKYINVEYNMPYIDCMDFIQMWALF